MEKVDVLGVGFNNVTMDEALEQCEIMLNYADISHMIVTPNPEIVMKAREDEEYREIINNASLVIPDGIGIIKAAEMYGTPLKERVAGYDLICNLFEKYKDGSRTFYFWGGKPGIAEMAKSNLEEQYPDIKILGASDGYFDDEKKAEIIKTIKAAKPDILLVGLGFPKQEKTIQELMTENIFKIAIGCGGTLDVLSGTVKRAPKLFIKTHMEWFWRLITNPSRAGRMLVLPKFVSAVKKDAKSKGVYVKKHISSIEKNLVGWATKHITILAIIALSMVALGLRLQTLDHEAWDYHQFLGPWTEEMAEKGGVLSLGEYPGDYTPPYMVILALLTHLPFSTLHTIKIVSIIIDFALAVACAKLVVQASKSEKKSFLFMITYGVVLFLPLVFLNSSVWGQCDNIYTLFVILSLLYMLKNKYFRSFLFLGIAFSFKLQFIFILPLYLILYFRKKDFSILYFLLLPLTLIVLSIPSLVQGMTLSHLFSIYGEQSKEFYTYLTLNFPSLYSLIKGKAPSLAMYSTLGIWLAVGVCALLFFYCISKKIKMNEENIMNLGLLSIMLTTFFLPCMHERYLYMGEVLSVLVFIAFRKNLFVPLALQIISIWTYCNYLFGVEIISGQSTNMLPFLTIAYAIVIATYAKRLGTSAEVEAE